MEMSAGQLNDTRRAANWCPHPHGGDVASRRKRPLVLLLCLFAIPAAVAVQSDEDFGARAHRDWPLSGGDWSNSRHSTLTQVTPANVSKLAGAWMKGLDGALRTMPVVSNGVMFVPTRAGVHAFNAADGRPVWSYRPSIPISTNSTGLASGEGLLFIGLVNTSMIALRQTTGELVWTYTFSRSTERATPLVLYDLETNRQPMKAIAVMRTDGYLFAFDRATGSLLFSIEERPVPQNAELHTAPTQPFPVGGEQIGPNPTTVCRTNRDGFEPPAGHSDHAEQSRFWRQRAVARTSTASVQHG
jgi:glucose dehydrogenase